MNSQFRSLGSGVKWNSLGSVGAVLSKVLRGAVIPKLLDPLSYGLFTSVFIYTRYLQFSDFGATAYFTKRLPDCHFNQGETEERRLVDQTYTLILISSIPVFLCLGLASLFYQGANRSFYHVAFPLLFLITLATKLKEFYITHATGVQDYRKAALASVISNYVSLLLTGGGVILGGALGGIVGMLVAECLVLGWVARVSGLLPRITFGRQLLEEWRGRIWLFLVSMNDTLTSTLDQIFILAIFDPKDLGIYGLGLAFGWTIESVSEVFNTTSYPKLMALAKLDRKAAIEFTHQTIHCYLLASLVALPFLMGLIEAAVGVYFVRYQAGLDVYHIMIFLGLARGGMALVRRAYIAFDREGSYIAFSLASSLVFITALGIAKGFGLTFEDVVKVIVAIYGGSFLLFYVGMANRLGLVFWKNLALILLIVASLTIFQFLIRTTSSALFGVSGGVGFLITVFALALGWLLVERDFVASYLK